MEQKKKIRVNLIKNQNQKESRPVFLDCADFDALKKLAANKFKFKIRQIRFFSVTGDEIDAGMFEKMCLEGNISVLASNGEDYVGAKGGKKKYVVEVEGRGEGEKESVMSKPVVRVIAKQSELDDEAIRQLESSAKLPFMKFAVGMPDLHPGKDIPVGCACASEGVIFPHLVGENLFLKTNRVKFFNSLVCFQQKGTDIGCGMTLFKTNFQSHKVRQNKWTQRMTGLETGWEGDAKEFLRQRGIETTDHDSTHLGTIGGGNHFAEVQSVEEVMDEKKFAEMGLNRDSVYLLVHSGSRTLGEEIFRAHADKYKNNGLAENCEDAVTYMKKHDHACHWAKANRDLIAHRIFESLGIDCNELSDMQVLNVWHNCVVKKEFYVENIEDEEPVEIKEDTPKLSLWLHRKGAAPADVGPVVIPGSRGAFSYLVEPVSSPSAQQRCGYSLAHGAGRKWRRDKARKMGEQKKVNELTTTLLGSTVICEDKSLLYEEAPEAYKEISAIISDLEAAGIIKVIAVFRPLITYKVREKDYSNMRKKEKEDN